MTFSQVDRLDLEAIPPVRAARWFQSTTCDSLLIFWLAVATFTASLVPEFIGFQTRFAFFAQEMLRHGPSFFPTTYGTPYPDYPAASTCLICLASLPFGRVTPFTTVLPTAVVSALILVVTYRIGAIHSRRWGLAAVLFSLFTFEFFSMSRSIPLDQYTSLATMLSFYLVYSSDCLARQGRFALLPFVWGLGFAFRGPIGLVIPAAVSCGCSLWNGHFRRTLLLGIVAAGTLALCVGGLLLAARTQAGEPFARRVLDEQVVGRLDDRGPGWTYYWHRSLTALAISYPLAIIVLGSRFREILRRRAETDRLLGGLAFCAVIVLVGMAIPAVKKTRYLLPIVPALSLVGSYVMVNAALETQLFRARRILLGICTHLPIVSVIAVGGFLLFALYRRPDWTVFSPVVLCLLIPLVFVARKLDRGWSGVPNRDMFLLAVGLVIFGILDVGIAEPVSYSFEETRSFVRQIETLYAKEPGTIVFWQVGPDAEDIKFMANWSEPIEPQFVTSLDVLREMRGTRYVIAKEETFRTLLPNEGWSLRVLARGTIGHRACAVFNLGESRERNSRAISHTATSVRR